MTDQGRAAIASPEPNAAAPAAPATGELVAFVDSSALVALADAGDATHAAAVAAYHELRAMGYRFFTTDLLFTEAYELLAAGPGPDVAADWLSACRLQIYAVDETDLNEARRLVLTQAGDAAVGLMNAVSLAVITRFGIPDIFAVDQTVLRALA